MMNEKKQNINLYKQLANRQDEANRMLENELNVMKQQSMNINTVNPEELEAIRQEEEELKMMENELKMTKADRFQEYQQMHWEDNQEQPVQNILGREAYAHQMIPQTNQNPNYDQVNESYQQSFHQNPSNVHVNNSMRYDDGSQIQNPIESRVINQQGLAPGQNPNVFNRSQNESFRNMQQQPGQYHDPEYGHPQQYQQSGRYQQPPQYQQTPQYRPPQNMHPSQRPYHNQPQYQGIRSQNSYRSQQSGYAQRPPSQRGNPLQRIPNRNFQKGPQGPPRHEEDRGQKCGAENHKMQQETL